MAPQPAPSPPRLGAIFRHAQRPRIFRGGDDCDGASFFSFLRGVLCNDRVVVLFDAARRLLFFMWWLCLRLRYLCGSGCSGLLRLVVLVQVDQAAERPGGGTQRRRHVPPLALLSARCLISTRTSGFKRTRKLWAALNGFNAFMPHGIERALQDRATDGVGVWMGHKARLSQHIIASSFLAPRARN